jgi:hypothetical protein
MIDLTRSTATRQQDLMLEIVFSYAYIKEAEKLLAESKEMDLSSVIPRIQRLIEFKDEEIHDWNDELGILKGVFK